VRQDWIQQKQNNLLLLDALETREQAAKSLLASDAALPVRRGAESVLADIERRRGKILAGIERCELAIRDLSAELKKLEPAYERANQQNRLAARLTGLQTR
jgi:hypothetical protein